MIDAETWPLPSESRRVALVLSFAEGVLAGATLAALFDVIVLRAVSVAGWVRSTTSVAALGVVAIFAVLCVRWFGILSAVHETPAARERSEVVRDWHETRDWNVVAAIAGLTAGGILATGFASWGWESMVADRAVVPLCVGVLLLGLSLYVYSWRRLGEF